MQSLKTTFRYFFESASGSANHFIARWLFLRALGGIYFSAFFALLFQVRGLIGSQGILPTAEYLQVVRTLGLLRFWYTPTLLWFSGSDRLLMALCWVGFIASIAVVANVWPRAMLAVCFLLSVFCKCGTGFLWVSVGRHVAGSGFSLAVPCAIRPVPWFGKKAAACSSRHVSAALGVVSDLLSVRSRQTREWRPDMAEPHSNVRVLPKRPITHLDRLVLGASSALVSYRQRGDDARYGAHSGLDSFSSRPLEDSVLLHRHHVANRRDRYCNLRLSQLPCPCIGNPVTG